MPPVLQATRNCKFELTKAASYQGGFFYLIKFSLGDFVNIIYSETVYKIF